MPVNKANFVYKRKRNKLQTPSYFQVLLLSQAFESILSLQTLSSLNIILLIFELDCLGLNHFARIVKILMDPTDSLAEGFYYDSIFRLLALCLTELVKVVWDFN